MLVIKALKNKAELAEKRSEQLATENDVLKYAVECCTLSRTLSYGLTLHVL